MSIPPSSDSPEPGTTTEPLQDDEAPAPPRFFDVTPEDAGQRLDRRLAVWLDRPRNQIRQWIQSGAVEVDGKSAKPSTELSVGSRVRCQPPRRQSDERMRPEEGPLHLLYEDDHLVVVNKPAALAVHPGAGRATGTLAHFLLHRFPEMAGVGGAGRPGIVHRLDLDTTGVMVVARREEAYQRLVAAFSERRVHKLYQAVAYGLPRQDDGLIDLPIGRHRGDRKKMAITSKGRPALTEYRCLGRGQGTCRLELDLKTGRTHQIRVHLKAIGHPLVGDPLYGEARWKAWPKKQQGPLQAFPRPALHAWRLAFDHPITDAPLQFEAPIPDDMKALWQKMTGHDWT